jgi:hypothetical protein
MDRISGVGEIAVTVHRQELGRPVNGMGHFETVGSGSTSKVHEMALKGEAKSHTTS